ncbi:MAG TPA: hypothetical protein VIL03_01210 [Clostridia bacterium]
MQNIKKDTSEEFKNNIEEIKNNIIDVLNKYKDVNLLPKIDYSLGVYCTNKKKLKNNIEFLTYELSISQRCIHNSFKIINDIIINKIDITPCKPYHPRNEKECIEYLTTETPLMKDFLYSLNNANKETPIYNFGSRYISIAFQSNDIKIIAVCQGQPFINSSKYLHFIYDEEEKIIKEINGEIFRIPLNPILLIINDLYVLINEKARSFLEMDTYLQNKASSAITNLKDANLISSQDAERILNFVIKKKKRCEMFFDFNLVIIDEIRNYPSEKIKYLEKHLNIRFADNKITFSDDDAISNFIGFICNKAKRDFFEEKVVFAQDMDI